MKAIELLDDLNDDSIIHVHCDEVRLEISITKDEKEQILKLVAND